MEIQKLQELGLVKPEAPSKPRNKLNQDQFLKLMTTQMTHQNPLKPMENTEFLTQMAQFGTVTGIQELQKSFADFASAISSDQTLQASNLVGRKVLVESQQALLTANDPVSGAIELENPATAVTVQILDTGGATVRTLSLGALDKGITDFSWDGLKDDGTYANPGVYQLRAEGMVDGENQALKTQVIAPVESVSLDRKSHGIKVNLEGIGSVDFKQIQQIL